MSDCVSVTEVSTAAAWLIGLAIVALVLLGWRKPARANLVPARARVDRGARAWHQMTAVRTHVQAPDPAWRRLRSVVAGFGLAVWVGAIAATVVGFGGAWLVVTLTGMLKR